ncbi:ABC transporter ATP-binding protein [Aerococcus kribbianus]|uniref:ABC transporter ATP-binding protein n=1 Tax=Aerococcus kribbianus TaxID=2999064 RepID=A0A9X3FM14_9LACT|nr:MULTISPECIES: ABC transporter ATP-binding protein [unclassified Aerococcus]MCZ0716845.1 ABC transporter ATP-binding protein [Aerococcus sp. YH-aer221]MCZ0725133.1 ABC transporter ATP-binding protein [Aerococcus sp. YH-aer222]
MQVRFEDVSLSYDGQKNVLDHLTFTLDSHHLVSILGPSGCGKSTTLFLIAGLLRVSSGKIYFDDKDVTKLDAVNRNIGMVFQNYALYPHLSVKDNIAFPLKMAGKNKKERHQRAEELARLVHIDDHLEKKPGALSGGQQQRVAIARALAKEPDILLMDEPLSNLDAKLRVEMREEIRRIQRETGITTIFVTHDQAEALSISDSVMVLNKGIIQQKSQAQDLYENPANQFVAQFIGDPEINLIALNDFEQTAESKLLQTAREKNISWVGIRPEHLYRQEFDQSLIQGKVEAIEIIAKDRLALLKTETGQEIRVADLPIDFEKGDTIGLTCQERHFLFFNDQGDRVVLADDE